MKKVYRLPPCPKYDMEGMESWLSDLASQGLILEQDGYLAGIFTFVRTRPQRLRYRLTSSPNMPVPAFWSDYDAPTEEAVALSTDMGWEYVCRRGGFYIYRSCDDNAPELNTDPQILAQTLKALRKSYASRIFQLLFCFVLLPCLNHFLSHRGGPLMTTIALGSAVMLLTALVILLLLLEPIRSAAQLHRLRKKLQREGDIDHHKDWRRGQVRYWCANGIRSALFLLWAILFIGVSWRHATDAGQILLQDYPGKLPFATVSELAEGTYTPDTGLFPSTIRAWSDPLAKCNFDYYEAATITLEDGTQWECTLYLDYHETVSPWLAQALAKEYSRYYRDEEVTPIELPFLDADYALAVNNHGTHLILRRGSTVVHAYLSQYSEYTLPLEAWAEMMAQSIGG